MLRRCHHTIAAKFVQGQLGIVIDDSYAELETTNSDATSISHDDFVKMIKPGAPLMPVCMESRRGMQLDK